MSTQRWNLFSIKEPRSNESGKRRALADPLGRDGTAKNRVGFSGTCENTSLTDWIQLVQMGRRDAIVSVRNADGYEARLWCHQGDIVDAACEGLDGESAVYEALRWEGGVVSVEFRAHERARRIDVTTSALLLNAAVRKDSFIRRIGPPRVSLGMSDTQAPVSPVGPKPPLVSQRTRWLLIPLAAALLSSTLLLARDPVVQPEGQVPPVLPVATFTSAAKPGPVPHGAARSGSDGVTLEAAASNAASSELSAPARAKTAAAKDTVPPELRSVSTRNPAAAVRSLPAPSPRQTGNGTPVRSVDEQQPAVRIIEERNPSIQVID